MRSNNSLLLLVPVLLAGCGGGYRDPPGLEAAPQQGPAPEVYAGGQDFPTSVDPRYAGPGTSYSAPGEPRRESPREPPRQEMPRNMPARDLGPQDAYSGSSVPPPANYPPQGGYPPTGYPPASYPPASQMPSPASAYPSAPLSSEQRYDNVGYAGLASETGTVSGAHRVLPPGSFVEVTALDNGKTIVVPITGRAQSSREIELSGAAAQLLGITSGSAPVRVRRIVPTPADQNRLSAGQPAESRFDTPPVLLRALRNRLTQTAGAAPPVDRPPVRSPGSRAVVAKPPVARAPVVRAPARQGPGYYVQLAALSNNARAAALAREAGGSVRQKGALWLVRTGPFKDLRSAQGARDGLSRRGYGEARIVQE